MHSFINPLPHPVTTFPEKAQMKETSSAGFGGYVVHRAHCQRRALKHMVVQPKGGLYPQSTGLDSVPATCRLSSLAR